MSDDTHEHIHDPLPGHNGESASDARGIEKSDDGGLASSEGGERLDGNGGQTDLIEREAAEVTQIAAQFQEYNSLLPPANEFNSYNPDGQKMLMELASRQIKAAYDDESRRQDRLVTAEIVQSYLGLIISGIIIFGSIVAATIVSMNSGLWGVAVALVSIPFVAIISHIFRPVRTRNIKPQNEKSD